jgi:DNA-directed RNA polymerase subunit beta'
VEVAHIKAKNRGSLKFHNLRVVQKGKEFLVLNRNGQVSIHDENGRELETVQIKRRTDGLTGYL